MSTAKYDLEKFLSDLQSMLNSNLNTQISAINTEKNDAITLKTIDSSAYILQTLNQQIMAFDPFILYGVDNAKSEAIGPETATTYPIMVVLIIADMGNDLNIAKRLFRYQRAIREVLEANWAIIGDAVKIKVESLAPVPFKDINTSNDFQAIGVSIEVTIVG